MMSPEVFSAFSLEMQKIAQEGGAWGAFTAPFQQARQLVDPRTARTAWGDLWGGSANTHELNRNALAAEIAEKNQGLAQGGFFGGSKALPGQYVDDISHAQGVRAGLRRGGWLANYGKYEGPGLFRRGANAVARHLPGQRTLLLAGGAMQAKSDLARREEGTGRERGAAERVLGTAGGLVGTAASSSPAALRAMSGGGLGRTAAGVAGGLLVGGATSAVGKYVGRKIDAARGFKPTEQPVQVTG